MSGDCYRRAMEVAYDLDGNGTGTVRICHGEPIGQAGGSAPVGDRYGHAWVEHTIEIDWTPLGMVGRKTESVSYIDRSNGHDIDFPRDVAYRIGDIDESTVKRYSIAEAAELAVTEGHYGPWGEGITPTEEGS